ncbi:MAG: GNAT family N-acetyltransferase [Dysgonamonadaceae bacterium]|jgi:GNAT superfamily N-acetyltransferase|nr:GNAT family N-acetyltransferase [Dysgonamonadaceae bacterium]
MDEKIIFRKAEKADAERIMEIIAQAKEQMRLRGSRQWQDGYPAMENIRNDIEKGYGFVLEYEAITIAYAAVIFDGEPAYNLIEGRWLSNCPYVVVHRLAVADEMKNRGVATGFMRRIEQYARECGLRSFRIDTNFDNEFMLKMLDRLGFAFCGEVRMRSGLRRAYEKLLF